MKVNHIQVNHMKVNHIQVNHMKVYHIQVNHMNTLQEPKKSGKINQTAHIQNNKN